MRSPAFLWAPILIGLAACADSPMAPGDRGTLVSASIAPGSMTVQALPVPAAWNGGATAVSGDGTIFATNNGNSNRPLMAWQPPYLAMPVPVAPSGIIPGTGDGNNDLGDVAGFSTVTGYKYKGVLLQGPTGTWTLVPHPAGAYNDVNSHGLNDAREMAGYISLPLPTGGNALLPVYFTGPGAVPAELPLPAGASFVGGIGEAINNAGEIAGRVHQNVGSGRTATLRLRAAIWQRTGSGGYAVELLPTGSSTANSNATGINELNQMSGWDGADLVRWSPDGSGGWIREKVVTSGNAQQIDRCGRVVGTAPIGGKNDRAFVWDGSLNVLPLPAGALASTAIDIAQDGTGGVGVVVGWTRNSKSGPVYPVRWTIPGCP